MVCIKKKNLRGVGAANETVAADVAEGGADNFYFIMGPCGDIDGSRKKRERENRGKRRHEQKKHYGLISESCLMLVSLSGSWLIH